MSTLNEAFKELNTLNEDKEENVLYWDSNEIDEPDDFTDDTLFYSAYLNSKNNNDFIIVKAEIAYDESKIEFNWEADGPATYVPYGDQMVKYDDGVGGLESVEASNAVTVEEITLEDINEISEEEACKMLNCSIEDLHAALDKLKHEFEIKAVDYLNEYYMENPPENDFEPEPDYDID